VTLLPLPPVEGHLTTDNKISPPWYTYLKANDDQSRALSVISTFALSVLDSTVADDFYEGITHGPTTWDPHFTFGGSTAATSYAVRTGLYVKEGNAVTAWGSVVLTTHPASTIGNLEIKGLPFTAANIAGLTYSGYVSAYNGMPGPVTARVSTAATIVELFTAGPTSSAVIRSSAAAQLLVAQFTVRYLTTQ
jgi:hypothetical protein